MTKRTTGTKTARRSSTPPAIPRPDADVPPCPCCSNPTSRYDRLSIDHWHPNRETKLPQGRSFYRCGGWHGLPGCGHTFSVLDCDAREHDWTDWPGATTSTGPSQAGA